MSDIVERLRRKAQLMPMLGGGNIKIAGGDPYRPHAITSSSYITDDGMRLVNPDGPEAATEIETLRAALRETLETVDHIKSGGEYICSCGIRMQCPHHKFDGAF